MKKRTIKKVFEDAQENLYRQEVYTDMHAGNIIYN